MLDRQKYLADWQYFADPDNVSEGLSHGEASSYLKI